MYLFPLPPSFFPFVFIRMPLETPEQMFPSVIFLPPPCSGQILLIFLTRLFSRREYGLIQTRTLVCSVLPLSLDLCFKTRFYDHGHPSSDSFHCSFFAFFSRTLFSCSRPFLLASYFLGCCSILPPTPLRISPPFVRSSVQRLDYLFFSPAFPFFVLEDSCSHCS